MPSSRAVALSTLMRLTVKPSFAAMDDVANLRSGALRLFDRVSKLEPGLGSSHVSLSACTATWIQPRGVATDRVLLYIPGGAFVVRTPAWHRALAGRIAKAAHARALVVFYRLAPEHPYPSALDDCIEAYESLLSQGISPAHIVVGGDSAGGNLTLALLLALRDRGRPLPAAAFAISPVTDLRDHTHGSRKTNQQADPLLSTLHRSRFNVHELYVGGDKTLVQQPTVSPVLGDFRGLPPLLFQVGSTEILLDDSRLAVEKAQRDGAAAQLEIWSDMPHVWHAWNLPESQRAIAQLGDFIRQHCSHKTLPVPVQKARNKTSAGDARARFAATLRDDHAEYSRVLSVLSRQSNHLLERPRQALALMREALEFITTHLDRQHHAREDVLFERLAGRAKRASRALHALHREHVRCAAMSQLLITEIPRLMRSSDTSRLELLQEQIDEFVDQQRAHIVAEERLMYSFAFPLLSTQDWRAIEVAAPPHDAPPSLQQGARAYPLLARYFNSNAPHLMAASNGSIQRFGLHKASEAYGRIVGQTIEACWMALRQNREAFRLASQSLNALCTPRCPPAYAEAVRSAYRTDIDTLSRWTDEWRTQLTAAQYNVRSIWR